MINPNVYAFWQEKPSKRFDAATNRQLDIPANTFLGTEINLFIDYYFMKGFKLSFVGSAFFPGRRYKETRGLPLDGNQKALLDRLDRTGFDQDRVPNLGDDAAYTLNISLEFKF